MGLRPKPQHVDPTQTWEDLDRFLQQNFSQGSKSKEPTIVYIDPDKYVMDTKEIIQSATENGYKTTIIPNGRIKFE